MTNKSVKITIVSVGIVIFVLLLNMRTVSEVERNLNESVESSTKMPVDLVAINQILDEISSKEEMLAKAKSYMNDGNPMQGVFMMREIANRYPEYIEALYFLGEASIKTGQFDKAIERFNKVLEIAADTMYTGYVEGAYLNLEYAYFQKGEYVKQKEVLDVWKESVPAKDTVLKRQIDLRIQELNNIQIN